jgi:hypothetical protein
MQLDAAYYCYHNYSYHYPHIFITGTFVQRKELIMCTVAHVCSLTLSTSVVAVICRMAEWLNGWHS